MSSKKIALPPTTEWSQANKMARRVYTCGYCDNLGGSDEGYFTSASPQAHIYICQTCRCPSFFFSDGEIVPMAAPGRPIGKLPSDLNALYDEARLSAGAGAHTAAVLTCRKILMHLGVQEKAAPEKTFLYYVEYLASNGFVPPRGKPWVDYIRTRGNEANHEIKIMLKEDSGTLILFVEMLLRFIYEFPSLVPGLPASP